MSASKEKLLKQIRDTEALINENRQNGQTTDALEDSLQKLRSALAESVEAETSPDKLLRG